MVTIGASRKSCGLILLCVLGMAGCKISPLPPVTGAPTAPTLSGRFVPAAQVLYPATPTTLWTSQTAYSVALCYSADDVDFLCWAPPVTLTTN